MDLSDLHFFLDLAIFKVVIEPTAVALGLAMLQLLEDRMPRSGLLLLLRFLLRVNDRLEPDEIDGGLPPEEQGSATPAE